MPHLKFFFLLLDMKLKSSLELLSSPKEVRCQESDAALWLWWNQSWQCLISEGERGWDLHDTGSKQWNQHLISMVYSGVHVVFSVGQSQFCLKCWKSQFWLLQLNLTWWLSVHPALFRWVLPTGCLWVALFFPTAAAAVTFIGYTVVYNYGRHSQKTLCCFPQIHTPEGIFGFITTRTNSQADLHLTKPNFQRQEKGRPSFRVQSWGVACPALSRVCTSPALHWAGKTSKAQVIVTVELYLKAVAYRNPAKIF